MAKQRYSYKHKHEHTLSAYTVGDGTTVTVGRFNRLSPPIDCGHCGRRIYNYKGPYDVWPWYCSAKCAAKEPIASRCQACEGVMRFPVRFGSNPNVIVCKGCALRVQQDMHKWVGWKVSFIEWILKHTIDEMKAGRLPGKYLHLDRDTIVWRTKRGNLPDFSHNKRAKAVVQSVVQPVDPPKPVTQNMIEAFLREKETLARLIRNGWTNQEGIIQPVRRGPPQPDTGRHYLDTVCPEWRTVVAQHPELM